MAQHDDVIDLGTASVEIQGLLVGIKDEDGGQPSAGLSND